MDTKKPKAKQVNESKSVYSPSISTMPKTPIMGAAHEIVSDLFEMGMVDVATMRRFDESCLTPVAAQISPDELKEIRTREKASQAVFARHLNVATATVSQWERGERKPEGPALKLIELVRAHGLAYIR